MKMNEVKSATWSNLSMFLLAKIKTKAKTPRGIYRAIRKEFGVDFFEDVLSVAVAILEGYIQICEDGIIVWGSWKEV